MNHLWLDPTVIRPVKNYFPLIQRFRRFIRSINFPAWLALITSIIIGIVMVGAVSVAANNFWHWLTR